MARERKVSRKLRVRSDEDSVVMDEQVHLAVAQKAIDQGIARADYVPTVKE